MDPVADAFSILIKEKIDRNVSIAKKSQVRLLPVNLSANHAAYILLLQASKHGHRFMV